MAKTKSRPKFKKQLDDWAAYLNRLPRHTWDRDAAYKSLFHFNIPRPVTTDKSIKKLHL